MVENQRSPSPSKRTKFRWVVCALWEWEEIKKLPKDPRSLEKAKGKAVKVIYALLPSLPTEHHYNILFMVRLVAKVVDSQWVMLARQGKMPKSGKTHLIETPARLHPLRGHRVLCERVLIFLKQKDARCSRHLLIERQRRARRPLNMLAFEEEAKRVALVTAISLSKTKKSG